MKLLKVIVPVALGVLFLGAGCSLWQKSKSSPTNNNDALNQNVGANINSSVLLGFTYQGRDGRNALELLLAISSVDVSADGFVNAINGIKPADRQFWAFYVNGQPAPVGARDYQTKSSDTIEWKLESY